MMIFCPRLTQHLAAEDPARLADQILYYTSLENAVAQATIVRQVALANALTDFASSVHRQHHPETGLRRLAVGSKARRLILVEVQPHFWLHVVRCFSHAVYHDRTVDSAESQAAAPAVARRGMGAAPAPGRLGYLAGTSLHLCSSDTGILKKCCT